MIYLGNKFDKTVLKTFGWILAATMPVAYIGFLSATSGGFLIFLIFVLPLSVLVGSCVMLVIGVTQIIKGFTYHKGNSIALGFVLVSLAVLFVIVPITLVSIFGLPIAAM